MIRASWFVATLAFTSLGLFPAACSLLLDDDAVQCLQDGDCARFPGTICNRTDGVCIARPQTGQTGSGGQGGTQGAGGSSGAGGSGGLAGAGGAAGATPTGGFNGGGQGGGAGMGMGNGNGNGNGNGMTGCPDLDGNGVRDCLQSLVPNGDFATGIAGWMPELGTTASFSPTDGEGDPHSGSLSVTNANQSDVASGLTLAGAAICLRSADASSYGVYLQVAVVPVPGSLAQGGITFTYYSTSDCSGSPNGIAPTSLVDQSATGWSVVHETILPTSGTRSLLVRLVVIKPFSEPMAQASFDNVLIYAN